MAAGKLFEGLGSINNSRLQIPSVVDFTAAQVLTLASAPVDLIQAPGSGYVICPVAATVSYKAGSVAFAGDPVIRLLWDDGTIVGNTTGTLGMTTLTDKQGVFVIGGVTGSANNSKLRLAAAIDPAGTGNGTLRVIILYMLLPLK